ncbi:MAG: HAD-IIIA family hydrolase [Ruminococcaceae bacterium]|nr:HAD-IIIA family hydrolase [Oscillospiraceae bacterium]
MKYKTVIFDLDGTLLDTLQDLTNSVNFALRTMNYPERTISEVRTFVGNGIGKLIERAVPENTEKEDVQETLQIFKSHYEKHCEDCTSPYPGIYELLVHLKECGIQVAVVSNKADFAVKKLCEKYFGNWVSLAIGEREGIRRKPAPDSVLSVLSQMTATPKETVYIGDSDVDIETAYNSGIDIISVTWGFRDKDFLSRSGALAFADSVEQLENLILEK